MPRRRGPSDRAGDPAHRRNRRALGRYGEDLAEAYLRRQGFRILARNLHLRQAELDLLALEGSTLCFIEVRLRSSIAFGSAAESVDRRKQRRIATAARAALATLHLPYHESLRFDVIAIDARRDPPEVELIRGAFTL